MCSNGDPTQPKIFKKENKQENIFLAFGEPLFCIYWGAVNNTSNVGTSNYGPPILLVNYRIGLFFLLNAIHPESDAIGNLFVLAFVKIPALDHLLLSFFPYEYSRS